jgi:hypothetical protein
MKKDNMVLKCRDSEQADECDINPHKASDSAEERLQNGGC